MRVRGGRGDGGGEGRMGAVILAVCLSKHMNTRGSFTGYDCRSSLTWFYLPLHKLVFVC